MTTQEDMASMPDIVVATHEEMSVILQALGSVHDESKVDISIPLEPGKDMSINEENTTRIEESVIEESKGILEPKDEVVEMGHQQLQKESEPQDKKSPLKRKKSLEEGVSGEDESPKKRKMLPEESTNLLKKWLLDHSVDPYPSKEEKNQLSDITGLSKKQIDQWFINARRRKMHLSNEELPGQVHKPASQSESLLDSQHLQDPSQSIMEPKDPLMQVQEAVAGSEGMLDNKSIEMLQANQQLSQSTDEFKMVSQSEDVTSPKSSKDEKKSHFFPKNATSVLKAWLHEHMSSPYPTKEEKDSLCAQTGLTIEQLNWWFVNARRRKLPNMKPPSNLNLSSGSIPLVPPVASPPSIASVTNGNNVSDNMLQNVNANDTMIHLQEPDASTSTTTSTSTSLTSSPPPPSINNEEENIQAASDNKTPRQRKRRDRSKKTQPLPPPSVMKDLAAVALPLVSSDTNSPRSQSAIAPPLEVLSEPPLSDPNNQEISA